MDNNITDKRNPYINSEGQRGLRTSILAFIDVIGFKALVRGAKSNNKSQEEFLRFHQVLTDWFNFENGFYQEKFEMPFIGGKKDPYVIRVFSDCILIGCPINRTVKEVDSSKDGNELFDFLSAINHFQMNMVSHGYFVRGA